MGFVITSKPDLRLKLAAAEENSLLFSSLGDTPRFVQREAERIPNRSIPTAEQNEMNWYYAEAGEQRGPITDTELSDLAKAGAIRDGTLVWREGMASWQPYGLVKVATRPPPPRVGEVVCWQCGKMFARDEVISIGEGWVCAACKPIYLQRLTDGARVAAAH